MSKSKTEESHLKVRNDLQHICNGCSRLEELLSAQDLCPVVEFPPDDEIIIHASYYELEACGLAGCTTCRLFRQALLMDNPPSAAGQPEPWTVADENGNEIYVSVPRVPVLPRKGPFFFYAADSVELFYFNVSIGPPKSSIYYAKLGREKRERYHQRPLRGPPRMLPADSRDKSLIELSQKWLSSCLTDHKKCADLRWSHNNPTRLIRLLRGDKVQLTKAPIDQVPYCALSYCWGMLDEEARKAQTTSGNIGVRQNPFSATVLPAALQDAISITRALNLEYIWIDFVCIQQDDDVDRTNEINSMHEVYGNAAVTLSSVSGTRVSDSMFQERSAWSLNTQQAYLGKWMITTIARDLDVSFERMRKTSPLALRGWTLQEERLSPRVLYWSHLDLFWSCLGNNAGEGRIRINPLAALRYKALAAPSASPPQEFLALCGSGQRGIELHRLWNRLVEIYTARHMSDPTDRHPGISGIAARYKHATGDNYIAGLWQSKLAQDLMWSVPATSKCLRSDIPPGVNAPSWS